MRKLKSFKFRRGTQHTRAAAATAPTPSTPALKTSSRDGNCPGGGSTAAATAAESTATADDGRNSSDNASDTNDEGVPASAGEGSTGSQGYPSPRWRRPRTCEDESCGNGGGGGGDHGGGRAGGGDGYRAESGEKTALSGGGRGEDSSNSDVMRAEDDMCAICLETYEDGDNLTGLPCRHSFHTECIQPWLSGKSALCPMCKSEAFGKGGLFLSTAPRLEAAFAELAALCTENLAVLGLFFLASVACGVIAAKLSLRE